ncbi:hypothetical protein [Agrobacterium larrymoorei]|nr:hypothetical protein [Agrobacterium larrymoorei]
MIEKHYAVHLKNTLDAEAFNVRRVSLHQTLVEIRKAFGPYQAILQAIGFGADPLLLAFKVGGALPERTVGATVDVNLVT